MSWQSYIDDQLLAGGFMYATINGHDGSLWANSPDFVVLPEEIQKLAGILTSGELGTITTNGFTIAGQSYTFTRGEAEDDEGGPTYVQGRCKEDGKSSQGVIVYCTNQAIVVGVHDPAYSNGNSFGMANTTIYKVANYMMENSY